MRSLYKNCLLCPRRCGVNREAGQRGYCGETSVLRIAFAGIHRGEEPPISGERGSGTIFVSGCNLGCAFCQNFQISGGKQMIGRAVDAGEFAEISLALQEQGAANINIVTGSHAAPALALGIMEAKARGLAIPVLWNSSGYEGAETLDILKGLVDVYLPDLKTLDPEVAAKFFNAPDYPEQAAEAVLKMVEYRKENMVRETLVSGVIIRHLVIPGFLENTRQVLRWFSENIISESRGAWFSLMTQYTPVREDRETAVPDRYVSKDEYDKIIAMLEEFGIEDGYCQALVTGSEWLPDFERQNPFSSALSVPVWHWRNGFIFYK